MIDIVLSSYVKGIENEVSQIKIASQKPCIVL